MISSVKNLESFFQEQTKNLPNCTECTKAYITNVFKTTNIDYSTTSLTLIYAKAKFEHRFDLYQNLGDWLLFVKTLFPENLNNASSEYYDALAQNSYYHCYQLLNKQWRLFEELADTFPKLVKTLRFTLNIHSIK